MIRAWFALLLELFRIPRVIREFEDNVLGKLVIQYMHDEKLYEIHVYCIQHVYLCRYLGWVRYKKHYSLYEVYAVVCGVNPDPDLSRIFASKIFLPEFVYSKATRKHKARVAIDAYIGILLNRLKSKK